MVFRTSHPNPTRSAYRWQAAGVATPARPPRTRLANVILLPSGLVAAFDQFGKQVPQYQGWLHAVLDGLLRDRLPSTRFERVEYPYD